jgi:NADPH:quinone reductase-like Zn-dependent oxidoreductase
LDSKKNADKKILIIGGSGGVGSMAIPLAKLAGLTVVATASRPESQKWVHMLGTQAIIDHNSISEGSKKIGSPEYDFIFNTQDTSAYWDVMVEMIAPEGRIVSIVETSQPLKLTDLMLKSATFSWELMFTKPLFARHNKTQHETLMKISRWLDAGDLRHTLTTNLGPISTDNLAKAHELLITRQTIGKIGLESNW